MYDPAVAVDLLPLSSKAMPIYEFFCPQNHKIYSFFARSLAYSGVTPRCPDNPNFQMERMVSSFAVIGRAREEVPGEPVDDPRMDAMMAEMEKEFSKMDSDNPDPRRVAHMLRSLTKMSGESMPEQMKEVLSRLESGESLDRIEDAMGDAMDALGPETDSPGGAGGASELKKLRDHLRAARNRPVRDPVMYEMADYATLPEYGWPRVKPGGGGGAAR